MLTFNGLQNLKELGPLCVALGSFDGLHKGHQRIIARCVNTARKSGMKPAVFSFSNHPLDLIFGEGSVMKVISDERKAEILEQLGVEILIAPVFTRDIMQMSPNEFVEDLILGNIRMKHAFCGFNYSFGFKAGGTPRMLRAMGKKLGFGIYVAREYRIEGVTASSTELRRFIAEGDADSYKLFTGRTFEEDGIV